MNIVCKYKKYHLCFTIRNNHPYCSYPWNCVVEGNSSWKGPRSGKKSNLRTSMWQICGQATSLRLGREGWESAPLSLGATVQRVGLGASQSPDVTEYLGALFSSEKWSGCSTGSSVQWKPTYGCCMGRSEEGAISLKVELLIYHLVNVQIITYGHEFGKWPWEWDCIYFIYSGKTLGTLVLKDVYILATLLSLLLPWLTFGSEPKKKDRLLNKVCIRYLTNPITVG